MLLCNVVIGSAQEFFVTPTREVATQIAIGKANRLDTYLSPEKYRGTEVRFVSQVTKDNEKRPLTYMLTHEGMIDRTKNRADNAHELSGAYCFSYAAMYRWNLMGDALTLRAGAMADMNLGFTYNMRNAGNNPAQGYGSLNLGGNVMAQYKFKLWNKAFRVNYEARLPLVGMMFSPNYGQSYYEIFNKDDYDHNIVLTSAATFQLRQQLSLDYAVSQSCALRIGYLNDIRQAKPNNLKQHHYYNGLTLGVVIKKPLPTSPKGRSF